MVGLTRRVLIGAIASAVVAPRAVLAKAERAGRAVFVVEGRAVRGVDVVAYFREGRVVPGADRLGTEWRGALWCFSSIENRTAFEQNPRAYAPVYGGYCSFGVAHNHTVPSDPEAWRIVDGRLYLFNSKTALRAWETDAASNITQADANWSALLERMSG